jgi:hypothetical protein
MEAACHVQQPGAAIADHHEDDILGQGILRGWRRREGGTGLDADDHVVLLA